MTLSLPSFTPLSTWRADPPRGTSTRIGRLTDFPFVARLESRGVGVRIIAERLMYRYGYGEPDDST